MKSEQQRLEELKAILEKEYNRPFTNEEVLQAYQLLKLLAEAAAKNAFVEVDRQAILKNNPKEFHLEESGTCGICRQPAANENSWYDKNGIKCITQGLLKKRIIPLNEKQVHLELFLIRDNKEVLAPKKVATIQNNQVREV